MNKIKNFAVAVALVAASNSTFAQADPKEIGLKEITPHYAMAQLKFLSSDFTEGRKVGSFGEKLSAEYIASIYQMIGLKPAGDLDRYGKKTYFQKVPMLKRSVGDVSELAVILPVNGNEKKYIFDYNTDFFTSLPLTSLDINSDVVFVGYGMIDEENNYNDFTGVDVKGKVVVRLNGFPAHNDKNSDVYKKFAPKKRVWRDPRVTKGNNYLKDNGALAIVSINTPQQDVQYADKSHYKSERVSSSMSYSIGPLDTPVDASLPIVNVTRRVAAVLVGDINELETTIAQSGRPYSKQLDKRVGLNMDIKTESVSAYNVLGMIEGEDTSSTVVVGAHYDHMGMKDGYIWNGADDNASGTVGIMTIAKAFLATGEKPACNVVFGAWTAEEIGFGGSKHFVKNFKDGKMKANVNFDMISREIKDGSDDVLMQYVEAMPLLLKYAKDNAEKYNIGVNVTTRPLVLGAGGSTDYAPFSSAMVPFISWKGGHRSDYHYYTDEIEKIDEEIFIKLIKMGFLSAWDITNKEIK